MKELLEGKLDNGIVRLIPDDFFIELKRLNNWDNLSKHVEILVKLIECFIIDRTKQEDIHVINAQTITVFKTSKNMKEATEKLDKIFKVKVELPFKFDDNGYIIEPLYTDNQLSDFDRVLLKALKFKK